MFFSIAGYDLVLTDSWLSHCQVSGFWHPDTWDFSITQWDLSGKTHPPKTHPKRTYVKPCSCSADSELFHYG